VRSLTKEYLEDKSPKYPVITNNFDTKEAKLLLYNGLEIGRKLLEGLGNIQT